MPAAPPGRSPADPPGPLVIRLGIAALAQESSGCPNGPHFCRKYSTILLACSWLTSTSSGSRSPGSRSGRRPARRTAPRRRRGWGPGTARRRRPLVSRRPPSASLRRAGMTRTRRGRRSTAGRAAGSARRAARRRSRSPAPGRSRGTGRKCKQQAGQGGNHRRGGEGDRLADPAPEAACPFADYASGPVRCTASPGGTRAVRKECRIESPARSPRCWRWTLTWLPAPGEPDCRRNCPDRGPR